ncbi:MAG: FkbM family methyltransferase [Nitrospinota bacterium]
MINLSKRLIKRSFNLLGLDIIKILKEPSHSFLGIKNLPIQTIIDVGANNGQFAKIATDIFPEARIYCFEPLPEPYKELEEWIEKQKNDKVTSHNLAVGKIDGTLEMFYHVEHNSSSSVLKTTKISEEVYSFTQKQVPIRVKSITLDNWVKSLSKPLAPEILIKLDVQGYEDRVIMGGKELFGMAKACILEVCLDRLYEEQATLKDISLLLYDLAYHYAGNLNQIYADDGHVIYIDAVFVKQDLNIKK